MARTLPDSGGHYYDRDTGGVVGIVRRNIGAARGKITSGDAGGEAVAFAMGIALIPVAQAIRREFAGGS